MDKKDQQYVIESSIKAIVQLIPGLGGTIGSLLGDALADRKEERLNIFLKELKDEIIENKKQVNSEFISKVDFLDIFEITSLRIANERAEQKRKAFKNILLAGIFSDNNSYDVLEIQIKILDQINADHILLLSFLKSPKTFNTASSQSQTNTILSYFNLVFPNWERDNLYNYLRDLEVNRLIENITENFQTMMSHVTSENFEKLLTSRGKTFISYILR